MSSCLNVKYPHYSLLLLYTYLELLLFIIHYFYQQLHTYICFSPGATAPQWAMSSSFARFLDHTQRHTTVGRTPLDEWSARSKDLYLTTQDTRNRQTSMPPVGFEPKISAGERPKTYALDRAATGTGFIYVGNSINKLQIQVTTYVFELSAGNCHR